MPVISVSVDNTVIASISTQGYDLVTVRAGGSATDAAFMTLDVAASKHLKVDEEGESIYHIFVSELTLQPGQQIKLAMLEHGENSHRGKTIKELFPDAETVPKDFDFSLTAEDSKRLHEKPRNREQYTFSIVSSSGVKVVGDTAPETYCLSFSALWNGWSPESTRVSLYSRTFDDLARQEVRSDHFQERISAGDFILFKASA